MTVEFKYDRDCPNVLAARGNLIKAIAASSREVRWTEWNSSAADSPPHVKGYGSPTVFQTVIRSNQHEKPSLPSRYPNWGIHSQEPRSYRSAICAGIVGRRRRG